MTPLLAHRSGRDRGFERLYQRHVGDVYRYALAVLRSAQDAEDVTQTTFLNAYRAWERGERPRRAQNWLIAIAHNVCRQRFRQSARRPSVVAFDESDAVTESFAEDDGPSADDIRRALAYLSFNQRAALVMRELEGRSYAEIAEILGLTVGAVETLIFRARRALREQLEGSLTCHEAELAVSRQLDGRLPRAERGALRAHLRECRECAAFARSQRAQRTALRGLALVPLPTSLSSFFGGAAGGAAAGGVAAKAAAVVAAGAVVGTAGYQGVQHAPWREGGERPAAAEARETPGPAAADGAARSSAVPLGEASAPVAVAKPRARGANRSTPPRAREKGKGALVAGVVLPGKAKDDRRPVGPRDQTPPGQAKKQGAAAEGKGHGAPGRAKAARAQVKKHVPPHAKKKDKVPPAARAKAPRRPETPPAASDDGSAPPAPKPKDKSKEGETSAGDDVSGTSSEPASSAEQPAAAPARSIEPGAPRVTLPTAPVKK